MKTLDTLIRVHKQVLDEKRVRLAAIEIERDRLHTAIDGLATEFAAEKAAAASSLDAARTFPAYAVGIRKRQQEYEQAIADLAPQVAQAAEAVAEAYRELKKYEISRELRLERENALEARREQARLDEVGNTVWRRDGAI